MTRWNISWSDIQKFKFYYMMNVAKVLETYKQSYKKEKDFAIGKVNQELKKQEILKNQLISHYSKDLLPESTRK